MCTGTVAPGAGEALDMLESLAAVLSRADLAQLPDEVVARGLRVLERADAVQAAVRGRLLQVFAARHLHLADGQRSTRAWLVHSLGVTRGRPPSVRRISLDAAIIPTAIKSSLPSRTLCSCCRKVRSKRTDYHAC